MSINIDQEQLKKMMVIKDLRIALKDLEPHVKAAEPLRTGREFTNFSLLPREIWANWLVCVVLRKIHNRDITFMEDREGDGFIVDRTLRNIFPTEHVSAIDTPKGRKLPSGERRIIDAINLKIARGEDYAENKLLIVFFDGAGEFFRDKIREAIFKKHNFEAVFCVGLLTSGKDGYSYIVTEFRDSFGDQSMTHKVDINSDFTSWEISQIMQ